MQFCYNKILVYVTSDTLNSIVQYFNILETQHRDRQFGVADSPRGTRGSGPTVAGVRGSSSGDIHPHRRPKARETPQRFLCGQLALPPGCTAGSTMLIMMMMNPRSHCVTHCSEAV